MIIAAPFRIIQSYPLIFSINCRIYPNDLKCGHNTIYHQLFRALIGAITSGLMACHDYCLLIEMHVRIHHAVPAVRHPVLNNV